MKSLKYILISIILIIGGGILSYFYYINNSAKPVTANVASSNILNVTKVQQQEITEEKIISKYQKTKIEYKVIKPSEVNIPILMYHSISDADPKNGLLVSPIDFEEQIKWLKQNDFTPMFLNEVIESLRTGKVPKRPVAITFDDGYADNYTAAFQILKKYRMKGTFFIITDNTDRDGYYMSSEMLKEMHDSGMAIENHTSNHKELNKLSKEDQSFSIKSGQTALKNLLNKDSKYLCYPVGRYNETTIDVEKSLGIEAAVTTNRGMASVDDGQYTLDRIRIAPMSIDNFKKIFSEFMQ